MPAYKFDASKLLSPQQLAELRAIVKVASARLAAHGIYHCPECGMHHADNQPHIPIPDSSNVPRGTKI